MSDSGACLIGLGLCLGSSFRNPTSLWSLGPGSAVRRGRPHRRKAHWFHARTGPPSTRGGPHALRPRQLTRRLRRSHQEDRERSRAPRLVRQERRRIRLGRSIGLQPMSRLRQQQEWRRETPSPLAWKPSSARLRPFRAGSGIQAFACGSAYRPLGWFPVRSRSLQQGAEGTSASAAMRPPQSSSTCKRSSGLSRRSASP